MENTTKHDRQLTKLTSPSLFGRVLCWTELLEVLIAQTAQPLLCRITNYFVPFIPHSKDMFPRAALFNRCARCTLGCTKICVRCTTKKDSQRCNANFSH